MSFIEPTMRSSVRLAPPTCWSDCDTRRSADSAFCRFCRVTSASARVEAAVSSSEAACSPAACASDWLEEATCAAAPATCSALSPISRATARSVALVRRSV